MANGHHDKAEQLALFRYQVISEAASPRLTPAERGRLARELAARTWAGPMGPSARSAARALTVGSPPTPSTAWPASPPCPARTGAGPAPPANG